MKDFFFLATMMDCSEREEMTFPKVKRDLFMLAPSCTSQEKDTGHSNSDERFKNLLSDELDK